MKYVNESGRSMVEMLGVLAIIGVLSVGGIAGYSKAMNKYKINKTTDQVSMLVANIRTLFSSQGNYTGLNNGSAIRFGIVPNDMYNAGSSGTSDIKNAFNGEVVIQASGGRSSGDGEAFNIVYKGLSQEACVTIATGDWGSGQASGLLAIAAGNNNNTTSGAKTEEDEDGKPITTTIGVDAVLSGQSSGVSVTGSAANGLAVAVPGGTTLSTPMTVTAAVNACTCTATVCEVAWKYY